MKLRTEWAKEAQIQLGGRTCVPTWVTNLSQFAQYGPCFGTESPASQEPPRPQQLSTIAHLESKPFLSRMVSDATF